MKFGDLGGKLACAEALGGGLVLALLFPGRVSLSKSPNLSEPQFFTCKVGLKIELNYIELFVNIKVGTHKMFSKYLEILKTQ